MLKLSTPYLPFKGNAAPSTKLRDTLLRVVACFSLATVGGCGGNGADGGIAGDGDVGRDSGTLGQDGGGVAGDGGTNVPPPAPFSVWTPAVPKVAPSTTGATYYVDGTNGSDGKDGKTVDAPFQTIKHAISVLAAGDTVLIKKGLYREGINITGSPQGSAGKPITFGSYGDGEVILDGSTAVTGWTVYSGTVWQAPISFNPVAVVVNEVPLHQVRQPALWHITTTASAEDLSAVTSGSGKWFNDYGAHQMIYADMGSIDPNTADIVVPSDDGAQQHVYFYGSSYFNLIGLTIRGSGAGGMWTYSDGVHGSDHITVQNCNLKFNGKSGVTFNGGANNQALYNNVYHNVLINWPFGNNGFADAGGGWPGALAWSSEVQPVARGNIVSMNGGEGIITYGDGFQNGTETGSALFEGNLAYDNWSMNMYMDNQPSDVARNNVLLRHPPVASDFIYSSAAGGTGYPWDAVVEKFRVCVSISDEYGSSADHLAHNHDAQLYNNLIVGCRVGIYDYGEDVSNTHGLKNALIANNTIIMDAHVYTTTWAAGILLQDNGTVNTNSVIENNIIDANGSTSPLIWSHTAGLNPGIMFNNNLYHSMNPAPFSSGDGTTMTLAGWQSYEAQDGNSQLSDPQFVDASQFGISLSSTYDYTSAALQPSSPAKGHGVVLPDFSVDLVGATRAAPWTIGAFQ